MHNRCDLRQRQHESNFAHTKIAYGEEEIETVGRQRFRLKKGFEKTQNSPRVQSNSFCFKPFLRFRSIGDSPTGRQMRPCKVISFSVATLAALSRPLNQDIFRQYNFVHLQTAPLHVKKQNILTQYASSEKHYRQYRSFT